MKSIGGGRDYPGGHTGSLYNSVNNSSKNTDSNNGSKCIKSTNSNTQICPSNIGCPPGTKKIYEGNGQILCKDNGFHHFGEGVSSGDNYSGYNSGGHLNGSGSGSHGSGVYAKCEDCGEKYEVEKKLDNDEGCCTLPSAFSRYLFVKVSDADMNIIATAPNTFFIYKPSWDGRDYPLSWDYNTGKHYEKYDFQWYYRVEEPGYIHGK